MRLLRPFADQGLAKAQLKSRFMYADGQGIPKDDAAAMSWYRSGRPGCTVAQFNDGQCKTKARSPARLRASDVDRELL